MADVRIRQVYLSTREDLQQELSRLGLERGDVAAAYRRGSALQVRCSGLSPAALRELKESFAKDGGACICAETKSEAGEALLVGTVPAYERLLSRSSTSLAALSKALRTLLDVRVEPVAGLGCRGHRLDLGRRTHIMGVINCTPDSFYAGSRRRKISDAVAVGARMVEEGADILDIGGESTRPGSDPVSTEEEMVRVLPVIEALAARLDVVISIDTHRAEVAREALKAGAHMVNDISGLRFDPEMAGVVRDFEVAVVVMHMKGRPKDMQTHPEYGDLMAELYDYFVDRLAFCAAQGVPRRSIVIDPGIGFGKRVEHNYEIIRRLRELTGLGQPLLLGPSRKSFIGAADGLPPEERLEGTAAAVAVGIQNGAHIVRVHDVAEMVRVVRVADLLAGKSQIEVRQ